jgi:YVTN family beta-propeller protein
MTQRSLLFFAFFAILLHQSAAWSQAAARARVLALYTTQTEPDHVQFAQQALDYFAEIAKRDHFEFTASTDFEQLRNDSLKSYRLVIWLNDAPKKPEQRAAFENYMKNGGAWLGFHFAGYNDGSTQWPWFVAFMGGAVFNDNSWPPMPAKLVIDSPGHPVVAGIPQSYVAPNNEWYIWTPSPRLNKDVQVLLTLDPSNYPIGLKGILAQGDLPVVWTNTRYKMVYMNMGHGNKIFASDTQKKLIENATSWLANDAKSAELSQAVATDHPAAIGTEISLRGIALNAMTHKVYAVDTAAGTVTVVDAVARTTRKIEVGSGPEALDINPETNKIYVANTGSANVSVIDGKTDAVTATITVGDFPYAIAANPATDKVYISKTFGDAMVVIDGKTNATSTLKPGMQADLIAVNPATGILYFTNYESNNVLMLDGNSDTPTPLPAGNHIWGAAADATTDRAYFSVTGEAQIAVVDGKTRTVSKVPTGEFPCAIAVDAVNHHVYVANYANDTVTTIDSSNNTVVATIATGRHPQAIGVDPAAHRVYVASTVANTVTVIDENSNAVVGTMRTENRPYAIVVDSLTHTVFVAGLEGEKLVLIDEQTLKVASAKD